MSSIAVFFVLGGATAFAAAQLGSNTVGTKQLKKNAVVSSKVKNGSLKAADFQSGQLPRGETGPKGETGARGETGAKGDAGAPGAPGTAKAAAVVSAAGTASSVIGGLQTKSEGGGLYCISLPGQSVANLIVSTDYNSSSTTEWDPTDGQYTIAGVVNNTTCDGGSGKVVRVYEVDVKLNTVSLKTGQFRVIVP
jgi:hypothetical protein